MENEKIDTGFIKDSFETETTIERYSQYTDKIGLWESEKHYAKKYIKTSDHILDIGCGAGRTTIALYEEGYKSIEGIDISDGMIKAAVQHAKSRGYSIPFIVQDVLDLNYDPESFDVAIFSHNGFMQIPMRQNRLKVLENVYSVLKPGGYFIFTTHERGAIASQYQDFWIDEKLRWEKDRYDKRLFEYGDRFIKLHDRTTFLHIASRQEVTDKILKSGFKLVEDAWRSDIAAEPDKVKDYSDDCRFWIVRKPENAND